MEHSVDPGFVVSFINIEPVTVLALLALGFLGGMLSGFVGSGGAFVLTPGMMNLGVLGSVAVASNMCHKFPKALVGAWKRRKLGHVDVKLGLVMGVSAVVGVEIGVGVQNFILELWGTAGSNLYISLVFVLVLFLVGMSMLRDARKAVLRGADDQEPSLARRIAGLNIPPKMYFDAIGHSISVWVTIPLGLATGLLAATIAVGGFIGVPSMIYILGVPPFIASGTELVIAFVMGLVGTYEWAMRGFVDLRLVVLILAGSLIGVQVGAIGTSYVKQYMIKLVTAVVMLLAGTSRALMIPSYLATMKLLNVSSGVVDLLATLSALVLYGTLVFAGVLITIAMVRGKREAALRGKDAAGRDVGVKRALSSVASK